MSSQHEELIQCPFCGKKFFFKMYDSVNVGLNPEYKKRVIDKTLFRYECPQCHNSDYVLYSILYHAPEIGYMIQVCWDTESARSFSLRKEVLRLSQFTGIRNYRFRSVVGYGELIEKILLFDAGLDDFAIELLKLTVLKSSSDAKNHYFYGKNDKFLEFNAISAEEPRQSSFLVPLDIYNAMKEIVAKWKSPAQNNFIYVDVGLCQTIFDNSQKTLGEQSVQW